MGSFKRNTEVSKHTSTSQMVFTWRVRGLFQQGWVIRQCPIESSAVCIAADVKTSANKNRQKCSSRVYKVQNVFPNPATESKCSPLTIKYFASAIKWNEIERGPPTRFTFSDLISKMHPTKQNSALNFKTKSLHNKKIAS